MEIKRFYASGDPASGKLYIEGEELCHLSKVLRYKAGYKAVACTGDGWDYTCTVESVERDIAVLKVDGKQPCEGDPEFEVTLFQSQPKSAKVDFIVQKAVELGAGRIVFFTSRYSAEEKFNLRRAEKIAAEACKQCGRSRLVAIDFEEGFEKALDMCTAERVVMPYERAVGGNMHAALSGSGNCAVDLIIGSEGGFSEEEALLAKERGARLISLGKRILRCETAAAVALALVQYERGQLGA